MSLETNAPETREVCTCNACSDCQAYAELARFGFEELEWETILLCGGPVHAIYGPAPEGEVVVGMELVAA